MIQIAFSVPGTNDTPIPIPGAEGMPQGGFDVVQAIITWGLTLIFVVGGIAAFAFIIYGGISWITSGGDKEKIEAARSKIVYAIIGLVVILSSYLIVRTVGSLFGVDPLNISSSSQCIGQPINCGQLTTVCNTTSHHWECKGDK